MDLSSIALKESTALVTLECYECHEDIDIGDTCYVDFLDGTEETHAKVFCERCVEEYDR